MARTASWPRPSRAVRATAAEVAAPMPGDDLVPEADVVMDRAFTLPGSPERAWPWFAQLGKNRSGWYFPRSVERFIPPGRRGIRRIDPELQHLRVGERIDDWGGKNAYFELAVLDPPRTLVHISTRGRMNISWAITLRPEDTAVTRGSPQPAGADATRVQLRLRLAPVRRRWLATTGGELMDVLTIAGLAAGLRERLSDRP